MANKVSIFIENAEGVHAELTNSKMSILEASSKEYNWESIFGRKIKKHSIIIADWSKNCRDNSKSDYFLLEECDDKKIADEIVNTCRKMLVKQYNRMMSLRVMKKYHLDENIIFNLEMEFHDSNNYEISLKKFFEKRENAVEEGDYMNLNTIGDVFTAMDELKTEISDKLEDVSDDDVKEELQDLLKDVEDEIRYFNEEDYYGQLKTYDELKERYKKII